MHCLKLHNRMGNELPILRLFALMKKGFEIMNTIMRIVVLLVAFFLFGFGVVLADGPVEAKLFVGGASGYASYRIPAVAVTNEGTVLAFCEGRKRGAGDSGDIDMLLKRSEDNGKTWGEQQVIWDDGQNVCGNPCPVVDKVTGEIFLLMTWNLGSDHEGAIIKQTSKDTRRVYITSSKDDGRTWSKPTEITKTTKLAGWTWYATGPCTGIQLTRGKNKGRLVVPCDHIEAATKKYYSHVIYSDDHGKTWKLGGSTPTDMVNECQAVELDDGKVMLNMRNYDRKKKTRAVSISEDGGMTWGAVYHDAALIEPICQASIVRYEENTKGTLVFSNPANMSGRSNMTVRLSYDQGKTWAVSKVIHEGPAAYSSLAVLGDKAIGLFYERGEKWPYETITFSRITMGWLIDSENGAGSK